MEQIIKQILRTGIKTETPPQPNDALRTQAQHVNEQILRVVGRALAIRHVDAGSCNGCELEIHCLNNAYYNIEGLGARFVASPRHADMLLVTGPVSRHMEVALKRTYDATPDPKLVVAVGDCAHDGGIFSPLDASGNKCESYAIRGSVATMIPVDVTVLGCPPTPVTILQGILTAVSK
jgi:Ni,Fe-hydrogenase III small subunit